MATVHSTESVSGPLRVVLASGSSNGVEPAMVVEPSQNGTPLVDGMGETATLELIDPPRGRLVTADGPHDVLVLPLPDPRRAAAGVERLEVVVDGWRFEVDLEPESRAALRDHATRAGSGRARGGPVELRAMIPGRVVSVEVAVGDEVEAGTRVLVVEAMKMQNELRAPRAGTVRRIGAAPGRTVELGDVLLVIE